MILGQIVTKFEVLPSLENGSPASCRIYSDGTAMLRIGRDMFEKYPFESRMFILLHELGHAVLNTGNEFEADKFAIREYAKAGYDLSKAIEAHTRILQPQVNPEHAERCRVMFYRIKHEAFLRGKLNTKKFKKLKV